MFRSATLLISCHILFLGRKIIYHFVLNFREAALTIIEYIAGKRGYKQKVSFEKNAFESLLCSHRYTSGRIVQPKAHFNVEYVKAWIGNKI